jgi:hypothetical protein
MLSPNPSTCSSSDLSILGVAKIRIPAPLLDGPKITENKVSSSSHSGDTVYVDIEMRGPRRDIHEKPRRWIFREVATIDRIHGSKLFDRCAVDVSLEHVLK